MSRRGDDLSDLVAELAQTTEELRDELDTEGPRLRPPTPSELVRFTSEVTIPAIVLVLETNVRALRLLQRTLRFTQGKGDTTEGRAGQTRQRAEELGRETLSRLDTALADLQDALSGRPPDDEARSLLEDAQELRAEVDRRLDDSARGETPPVDDETETVPIDVESELQSIKDNVDDEPSNGDTDN